MLVKSSCQNCGGHLEFDLENAGEQIECPHCQQTTALRVPSSPKPSPKRQSSIGWLIFGAALLIVLCPVIVASFFGKVAVSDAASAVGGVFVLAIVFAIGVAAIILVIFWIIFPWMVYHLLKRMNEALKKIEENTRRQ